MRKKLRILAILLTLVFNFFNFASRTFLPVANATYVEGPITQDTIWAMVDSPFVVSKDIVVYPNATLTIEPGVEVKFGGAFSLIISGKLYANGTEKPITFTSNKEEPVAGSWKALMFNGPQKSMLTACSIAHAIDGIYIENGDVEIENTNVSLCSYNGINATNSKLLVQNSIISENLQNGMSITGNGQATILKNTIMSNGNGILLTGSEVSSVNITQNKISANMHGIQIDADTHTSMEIIDNTVSSNDVGFYVSSLTSMSVTNNSFSYNNIGIFFNLGNHVAQYNDIYGNAMGVDVASNTTANAEHNYWGDPSGPHHETLNPSGTGNPVGGDGVNLDFIPFLAKPVGEINKRPIANLLTDRIWIRPNEDVMFFATDSSDEDGRIEGYFFDFADGNNSGWTTLSIFAHKYSSTGTYYASVRAMDDYGATSTTVNTTIYVQNLPQLYVRVGLSDHMIQEGEQISVVVYVTNGTTAVENATVTLFSVKGGEFTQPSGLTNTEGYFATMFTAPDQVEMANIRIVARASKMGYTDGSDYEYLEVSPILSVEITANPDVVKSEGTAQVTVHVRSDGQTISNASVRVSSTNGNLSSEIGITDLDGAFPLVFTAPKTTTTLNVSITATAAKSKYIDGVGQILITIEPKILTVNVAADADATISEGKVNVTVHVGYEAISIEEANVTVMAETGNFSATTGLTDSNGDVTFVFTAPAVKEQTDINVIALATKDGYAANQGQFQITVAPRTFSIEITVPTINSQESASVTVRVTCVEDAAPVADAAVSVLSTDGTFSDMSEVTDSGGYCAFVFNAPETTMPLSVIITVNVTKTGFTDGGNQTAITVNPKTAAEGGWPIWTILLIVIPIAIVIIVVVLVKLKYIAFSVGEEES